MSDVIPVLTRNENAQAMDLSKQTVQNLEMISRTMENFFRDYERDQIEEDKEKEQDKKDLKKETTQKEKRDNKKEKKERGEFTKAIIEAGKKSGEAIYGEGFKMLLGPLRLITEPLENFLGINFKDIFATGLKSIGGKIKGLFQKEKVPGSKEKPLTDLTENLVGKTIQEEMLPSETGKLFMGKPTRQTVLPIDPGAVLLFDLFTKGFKKDGIGKNEEGLMGLFGDGGVMKSVGPMIAKLGGIAMLIGGIVWAVMDGISGFFKAKEWGTSKVSGVIGGILGGTSKGLEGAMGNMGKWALIGAGIGTLIMPFVGTLIGGLLGGALGFILGWIGGERIAKFFDMVGSAVANFFTKTIPEVASNIWNAISGFFSWIWGGIIKTFNWIADFIGGYFTGFIDNFINFFSSFGKAFKKRFGKESKKSGENLLQKTLLFFTDIIKNIGSFVWGFIDNIIDTIKKVPIVGQAMTWVDEKVIEPIKGFFKGIFKGIQEFISDPKTFINNLWGNIINKVSGFFDSIKKGFDEFIKDPMGFIGKELNKLINSVGEFFADMGREFEFLVANPIAAISAIAGDKKAILKKEAFKEKKRTEDELKRKERIRMNNEKFLREQRIELDKENLSFLRRQGLTQAQIDAEIQSKITNIKKGMKVDDSETKQLYQSLLAEMAKQKGKENVVLQNITNTGSYNPDVQMSGGVFVY